MGTGAAVQAMTGPARGRLDRRRNGTPAIGARSACVPATKVTSDRSAYPAASHAFGKDGPSRHRKSHGIVVPSARQQTVP